MSLLKAAIVRRLVFATVTLAVPAAPHDARQTSSSIGCSRSAPVRGTAWTMTARCDGALTRDTTDSDVVTDFVRHKTIVLHAGQSYLAPG